MRFSPIVLLLFAMMMFLVGCGKKEEAAAPEAQSKATPQAYPKVKEAKKVETATPKEAVNPWDTPTRLTLFMAQKIEDALSKAIALRDIASALAEAGDKEQALATLKQALELAQKIENAIFKFKASALTGIAVALAETGEIKQAFQLAQKI